MAQGHTYTHTHVHTHACTHTHALTSQRQLQETRCTPACGQLTPDLKIKYDYLCEYRA